ncbi:PTS lactose/cellobiose transporter subunit IIA [Cytobacillus spongiae]|jgi:PTS system cellobiose-specific IIA component|uniref:PTS lactose/cellobiose transporter subunit IIA n=1 Tax=Cytobacillus spongiae TaxID=2901381 RepID=UPI001F399212|nr:PTS lactose/cellobiose transporter subunit IIA [Cytobacillus spongiae]UII55336.1 PTS lactose/cellobiose transporter subunit IIA [Cytobacillus spongiae]
MSEVRNIEMEIFEIISNGGNAKSTAYEALSKAHEGNFAEADQLVEAAHQDLNKAHKTQTQLIQAEINGDKFEKSLLMIHAQDHLMTSISEISLIEQMIKMLKRIDELEKRA